MPDAAVYVYDSHDAREIRAVVFRLPRVICRRDDAD